MIAIENVRLFTELEARNRDLTEALEQQTATSEILRVISRSQTDVQPVFDTIVASGAATLRRAARPTCSRYDGELIHLAALVNVNAGVRRGRSRTSFRGQPGRDTAVLRAILTGERGHDPGRSRGSRVRDRATVAASAASAASWRVPLLRDGKADRRASRSGAPVPGPFPDTQVALLQTFADQAVIAIENVRLFNELGQRNRDLTRRSSSRRPPARSCA